MRKQLIALGLILITSFIGYAVDIRGEVKADEADEQKRQLSESFLERYVNKTDELIDVYGIYGGGYLTQDGKTRIKRTDYPFTPLKVPQEKLGTTFYVEAEIPEQCIWKIDQPVLKGQYNYCDNNSFYKLTDSFTTYGTRKYVGSSIPRVYSLNALDKIERYTRSTFTEKKQQRLRLTNESANPFASVRQRGVFKGYFANIPGSTRVAFVVTDFTASVHKTDEFEYRGYHSSQNWNTGRHYGDVYKVSKRDNSYMLRPAAMIEPLFLDYRLHINTTGNKIDDLAEETKKKLGDVVNGKKSIQLKDAVLAEFDDERVIIPKSASIDFEENPISSIYTDKFNIDKANNKIEITHFGTGRNETYDIKGAEIRNGDRGRTVDTRCLEPSHMAAYPNYLCAAELFFDTDKLTIITIHSEPLFELNYYSTSNIVRECQAYDKFTDTTYRVPYGLKRDFFKDRINVLGTVPYTIDPAASKLVTFYNYPIEIENDLTYGQSTEELRARYSAFADVVYYPKVTFIGEGWSKYPEFVCPDKNTFRIGSKINLPNEDELAKSPNALDFGVKVTLVPRIVEPTNSAIPDFSTHPDEKITLAPPCKLSIEPTSTLYFKDNNLEKNRIKNLTLKVNNATDSEVVFNVRLKNMLKDKGELYNAFAATYIGGAETEPVNEVIKFRERERHYAYMDLHIAPNQSKTFNLGDYKFHMIYGPGDGSGISKKDIDAAQTTRDFEYSVENLEAHCPTLIQKVDSIIVKRLPEETPLPTTYATPLPTSTATPKPTATATPVPTATATATPKPSPSATPTPTIVSKPNPSNRPSPTATATTAPKPVPTNTTKPAPTATASTRPTNTNSPRPTVSATPKQTPTPTPKPSNKPSNGGVGSLIRDTVNNLLNAIFNRR